MVVLTLAYYVCWSFGLVFLVCGIGEQLTCEFNQINNTLIQLEWYSFPFELQRTLPTILYNVQKSIHLECFGSQTCSREVFRKVSKKKSYTIFRIKFKKINNFFASFHFPRLPIKHIHTLWFFVNLSNEISILLIG